MKFPKSKRIKIKELPESGPCIVCLNTPTEWHHMQSRGAGGGDEPTNLVELCRGCHSEAHAMGMRSFAEKYNLPVDFLSGYPKRNDF